MSNSNILSIQQEFKKNLLNKMKIQNKRYQNSLKIIEKLLKENKKLKTINKRNSTKKTKKRSSVSDSITNKNNKDFTQNIEIKSMFKKMDTALNNILSIVELMKKKKYLNKIEKFLSLTDEQSQTLLMKSIKIINDYIESNMNIVQGVLVEVDHNEIFEIFDQILKQNKLEDNLILLEKTDKKITKIKRNRLNTFYLTDVNKLENKLNETRKLMNRNNVNISEFRFTYKDGRKNLTINLNQIKEKIKDCLDFIEKENKFAI